MARSRNIKHGLYLNEELAELSIYARYLFPCLWCLADKHGRMEYRPKKIKAEAYPYDDVDIPALLLELHEKKFISVYGYGNRAYIQVHNWDKHQNPHPKEKASEIPDINDPVSIVATIELNESHEKKFKFTEKHGGAVEGDGEAEKFNLIPDSNPSDSLPLIPKATVSQIESLYRKYAGVNQFTGGQVVVAQDFAKTYTIEAIEEAFQAAAGASVQSKSFLNWCKTRLERTRDATPPPPAEDEGEKQITYLRSLGCIE